MDIVQNITNVIDKTPITLTEIERQCGFPKSSIRKWSENIPSISKVAKVAELLNVSLDILYYGKEKSSSSELKNEELELLEKFNKLLDIDKGRILDRMESIFESYSPEQKENVS